MHTQGFINSPYVFSVDAFQNYADVMWKYLTTIELLNSFNNAGILKIASLRAVRDVLVHTFDGKELNSKSFFSLFHVFKITVPSS